MSKQFSLNVGDLVVRYGKVLKVFNVKKDAIELQPFFRFQASNNLTFSLRLDNAYDGHIRRLVSKDRLKQLLDLIIKNPAEKKHSPVFDAKIALSRNRFAETLRVIKNLWQEKQEKSGTLPGGKLSTFRQALLQSTEEIAAVSKISPEKAKLLLLSDLKSSFEGKRKK